MKVTKLIREYVEKTIDACYPEPDSVKSFREQCNKASNALTEMNDMIIAYANSILPEIKEKYNVPDDFNLHVRLGINYAEFSSWNTQLKLKADEDKRKTDKAKQQKRDEILLSLELGATKADLDDMIKRLVDEVEPTREGVN